MNSPHIPTHKHPLVLLTVFVLTLIAILYAFHVNNSDSFDPYILMLVSFIFWLSALFMIFRTRWHHWTILGAGLSATFVGDGLLYGLFAYNSVRTIPFEYAPEILVAVRSLFIFGGVWIAMGLAQETWTELTDHQKNTLRRFIPKRRHHGRNS